MSNTYFSCNILAKIEISPHIFEKYSNITFLEYQSGESRVVPCGRVDKQTKRHTDNFTNAPKNRAFLSYV